MTREPSESHPPAPASAALRRVRVSPWRAGLLAARANAVPGVVLSVFAVALLLAYWYVGPVHEALEKLGRFKVQTGYAFSAISTALFGGLIPGLVQRVRPRLRATMPWPALWFLTAIWGIKGMEVDLLYRLQAMWFGDDRQLSTILPKIALDMGLYCPLWAVPTTVLCYAFKDAGFSWRRTAAPLRELGLGRWYLERVLPVAVSNWAVWVPAVCVIYCLPLALQLPMQNLVLCFWSLLLVLQVQGGAGAEGGEKSESVQVTETLKRLEPAD